MLFAILCQNVRHYTDRERRQWLCLLSVFAQHLTALYFAKAFAGSLLVVVKPSGWCKLPSDSRREWCVGNT